MTNFVPAITHSAAGTTWVYEDRIEWGHGEPQGCFRFDDPVVAQSPALQAYIEHLKHSRAVAFREDAYWRSENEKYKHRPLWKRALGVRP